MAIQFPADPSSQNPPNTFGPDSTPVANTVNTIVYFWDGEKWNANADPALKATYVATKGDNMTGNLTLGGDKLELNATNGSITAVGQVNTPKVNLGKPGNSGLAQIFGGNPSSKDLVIDVYNGSYSPIQMFGNGTITATGNLTLGEDKIKLDTNGSANFAVGSGAGVSITKDGKVATNGNPDDGFRITADALFGYSTTVSGAFLAINTGSTGSVNLGNRIGASGGVTNISLNAGNGSITATGDIYGQALVGTQIPDSYRTFLGRKDNEDGTFDDSVEIFANGNATFDGNVTAGNVRFNLEKDDPDAWETREESYEEQITGPLGKVERTVTRTREVKEYVGATLSVKDELIALRDRATKQDEVIAQMTRMLADLGADVSTLPANDSPAPKKKGGKR